MNQTETLQEILRRRGLAKADGRALFSYRIDENDYGRLERLVRQMLQGVNYGKLYHNLEPMFCLYAAETFRREHANGPWSWETVFRPLGVDTPPPPTIHRWVSEGLDWWKRPLLRGHDGTRLFLVTIACEGGLPLRLLEGNAPLANFFRELLEDYHCAGCLGEDDAYTRAKQNAHRLPPTHRQEVVFQLSGKLVATVVQLWKIVGDVPEPIAALDQKMPDWRERLPLRADDATVNALLAPLIEQVAGFSRAATARLYWRGVLRETTPTHWKIEKVLELPETIQGTVVRQWLNLPQSQPLPGRLRLLLKGKDESEVIAWLTRSRGVGDNALYRREWLRRGGLRITGDALLSPHAVELHDGLNLTPLPASGEESWAGELPWLFVEKSGSLSWQSQGSARTRAETAWAVVPATIVPEKGECDDCRCVGQIAEFNRAVYQVRSTVRFISPEGEIFQVICKAPDDTDELYRVCGDALDGLLGRSIIYQGLPRVLIEKLDGHLAPFHGRCEWRSVGYSHPWRSDGQGVGLLWLRLVDAQDCERFRRQMAVVPPGFRIERSLSGAGGTYRLSGLGNGEVSVHSPGTEGIDTVRTGTDELTVSCPALTSTNLPLLTFQICWSNGHPITFDLPYPHRGAVFFMGGRMLSNDAIVPVDRCGGLELVILDPAGHGHYDLYLEGALNNAHVGYRTRLPPLQGGRLDYCLHPFQDQIVALLASRNANHQNIRIVIRQHGHALAQVVVRHFDASLIRGADLVSVQTTSPDQLDSTWQDRLTLSMFPLWDPTHPPLSLTPCPDQPLAWQLPDNLEVGPWWVIGRDRDWARFRPLLWQVQAIEDEASPVESRAESMVECPVRLETAIREADQEQRQEYLNKALKALAADPNHSDWPSLFSYVELTREFSPNTLDVLRALLNHPRTLAMTLMASNEDSFDRVWCLAEGLPFLWWLIPVTDWLKTGMDYLAAVQSALGKSDENGSLLYSVFDGFRNRTQTRYLGFNPLCDWLQEHIMPRKKLTQSLMRALRAQPQMLDVWIAQREGDLQARHMSGESWPIGPAVLDRAKEMAFAQFRFEDRDPVFRPVRCAPFVAADTAIKGIVAEDRLVLDLRLIRSFDQPWFDEVYSLALAYGLSQLPPAGDKSMHS